MKEQNLHSMFLAPISENEILECLSSLEGNKANGPSSIPSNIVAQLKTIFNLCFSAGTFPEILKKKEKLVNPTTIAQSPCYQT